MKLRGNIILACLILCAGNFSLSAHAQEKTVPSLDLEDYRRILDELFPRNVMDKPGPEFVMVLRYLPSFEAESQIVIAGRKNEINVIELTSLDGNIFYRLTDVMQRTGEKSSVELAKYIRVKRRELKISVRRLNLWRRNLIESVSKSLRVKVLESTLPTARAMNVMDDGTSYEFWDHSLSGDTYFTPSGIEETGLDFSGKRLFVRWMERIKREVVRSK
jgi:hypothetical protein